MNNPKISIIVPVYNAEKYLYQCLNSVITQTFTNWECILVDDGSSDNSGAICDEYVAKDDRFRVYHKENEGVSMARNHGIEEARGKWLYFSDADDTLERSALSDLFGSVTHAVDMVMGGYTICSEDGTIITFVDRSIRRTLSNMESIQEMYSATDFPYQGYLWCKLFKSSIIKVNNLRFDVDIHFNEDRLFVVRYLCNCNQSISYFTKSVYNYIKRDSGAMASLEKSYNPKFASDMLAFGRMYEALKTVHVSNGILLNAKARVCQSFKNNIIMMQQFGSYDENAYKLMRNELCRVGLVSYYLRLTFKQTLGDLLRLLYPKMLIRQNHA